MSQIGCRSSVYSPVSTVRKFGSFIYEDFMATDGTDVKVCYPPSTLPVFPHFLPSLLKSGSFFYEDLIATDGMVFKVCCAILPSTYPFSPM